METTPYWLATGETPAFPSLKQDLKVDVVVVGGGITGVTAAYLLKQAGKKVALIERSRCAHIDSGHTTAHVTYVTDAPLSELVNTFGKDHAKAAWDAGQAAIDQITATIRKLNINCDFHWVSAFLHAVGPEPKQQDIEQLKENYKLATEFGFRCEFLSPIPKLKLPGIHFHQQALFHPVKYLNALLKEIDGEGSFVFENSAIEELEEKPTRVKAGENFVECDYLVLATHTPLTGKKGLLGATLFQTKLFLYSTYAIGAILPSGFMPEGSYWDTGEPYDYLRVEKHPEGMLAILGGEDHKTGQRKSQGECYLNLEHKMRKLCPEAKITHHWSGQVIETHDGLPYIGETAEKQFAATGYAGNGMTFGTLAGMMACDAVLGRRNPWKNLFDPNRKQVDGAWNYLVQNKDYPYYLLRDRLARAEGTDPSTVQKGEGKILKLNGQKVAVSRSDDGSVHKCSAVCTHMGCIVHWNTAEKTWDCPCHGSRFTPAGGVISGPAESPLERVE